ncbi:MAG: M20/M25/M40 family metallo-hydrolase [Vicinamibacterales bacterium]
MKLLDFAREFIDIDSTTGREAEAGRWLASKLRALGYRVAEQPVAEGRFNILATLDAPRVVFSTHYDCVPPFFGSSVRDGLLYGRGACDAKGILAAQVAAAERLHKNGERRIGMLYVVGEERGSDGAKVANQASINSKFLINGEPTDNRLGAATRGVLRLRLHASGRAAHSSAPELGESAIDKLLDALMLLRTIELPTDPIIGPTYYTIGLIEGGIAPNVIPPVAWAEALFRTSRPADEVVRSVQALTRSVRLEEVLRVPHVRLQTLDGLGIDTAVFPFATDIPFLTNWGTPLLFGPGSFHVAHTSEEHVRIAEMEDAVEKYVQIATACLARV